MAAKSHQTPGDPTRAPRLMGRSRADLVPSPTPKLAARLQDSPALADEPRQILRPLTAETSTG